jgi:hypothetical protein
MAIRFGSFIFRGDNDVLLERLQSGGPGNLNIPVEKINELGNYKAVAQLRDTPELQFQLQSFDPSSDLEVFLTGETMTAAGIDLALMRGVTIVNQLKPGEKATSPFSVVASVVTPSLLASRVSYRFAQQETSTVDVTLNGDAIFYAPGPAYVEEAVGSGVAGQTITLAEPAGAYVSSSGTFRALAVTANGRKLVPGADYTEVVTGAGAYRDVDVVLTAAYAATVDLRVYYFSNTALSELQAIHTPDSVSKPAALRGKNVEVYIGGYDPLDIPGSQVNRWTGVRSATAEWSQQVESDYELGNAYATDREANDTPTVNGTVQIRPVDVTQFFTRLRQVTGVAVDQAIGTDSRVSLELDYVLKDSTGGVIKRIHVPDAEFDVPGFNPQVQQKVDFDLNFTSVEGTLKVYND